ncbi:hypothetical protein EJ08DRAFT_700363 [Tothia fuscella]|uniref:Uncharacterized protein n=1 Tax=Tothia fuscella TaxID=1048955 RepID=A0A9P4TUP7_9PEZI|nr:hypothetical protein EJ08DRAFT_700363 [Tothia fuscella]
MTVVSYPGILPTLHAIGMRNGSTRRYWLARYLESSEQGEVPHPRRHYHCLRALLLNIINGSASVGFIVRSKARTTAEVDGVSKKIPKLRSKSERGFIFEGEIQIGSDSESALHVIQSNRGATEVGSRDLDIDGEHEPKQRDLMVPEKGGVILSRPRAPSTVYSRKVSEIQPSQ